MEKVVKEKVNLNLSEVLGIGYWILEIQNGESTKLYADKTMLKLLGIKKSSTPEQVYVFWYENIIKSYLDDVGFAIKRIIDGEKVEIQYEWNHPEKGTVLVRFCAAKNTDVNDKIRIEGFCQNVEEVSNVQNFTANSDVISEFIKSDYIIIFTANLISDVANTFSENPKYQSVIANIDPETNPSRKYSDRMKILYNFVKEEDKENFYNNTLGIDVVEKLCNGEEIEFSFSILYQNEEKKFYLRIQPKQNGKDGDVIIGIRKLDDICTDSCENTVNSKLSENIDRLHYSEIAKALSDDFESIFYINIDDNSYLHYDKKGTSCGLIASDNGKDFFKEAVTNIDKKAYPEDKSKILNAIKKENLLAHLEHNDYFIMEYRLVTDNKTTYFKLKALKLSPDSNSLVVLITNINQEVSERLGYRKELEEKEWALLEARTKAEEANAAKSKFLFNMSHDIRTPMNAIIGFTELALNECDNTEKLKDYLGKVLISSNHLLSLINDVLDMSRIEAGKVVINEKIESIKNNFYILKDIVLAEPKARELEIDFCDNITDDLIYCDKLRLNQILLNVISNSVKYTLPGGKISVQVNELKKISAQSAIFEFRIKDNGIGMSKEFLQTLYEPFSREKTSTVSGIQGTGLGMAITKNLVEIMKGSIDVHSEQNFGTETVITFSFNLAQELDIQKKEKEDLDDIKNMKVLLVDDNDYNREIAKIVLSEEGVIVDEAANGKEAFDIIVEKPAGSYDLILMDVQMPVMDGYKATELIRNLSNKEKAAVPIIAMTANAFEEDRLVALKAGMNEHLSKPVDTTKLKKAMKYFGANKKNV